MTQFARHRGPQTPRWVRGMLTGALMAFVTTSFTGAAFSDANAGTLAAPWRTLSFAVAQLYAGDTLFLRGGTYSSPADSIDSQAITIHSGG